MKKIILAVVGAVAVLGGVLYYVSTCECCVSEVKKVEPTTVVAKAPAKKVASTTVANKAPAKKVK